MISYTTLDYYTNKYLMGKQAVIDTALFPYWSFKATQVIKKYTFDNVNEAEPFIDELQMCCCELAEALYTNESNEVKGNITSEKVGEYSVSYEDKEKTEQLFQIKCKEIVFGWLGITGLLYRGCC